MGSESDVSENFGVNSPKNLTYFIDIDGTILEHQSNRDLDDLQLYLLACNFEAIDNKTSVLPKFLEWQSGLSKNHKIILTTARPIRHSEITEYQLNSSGVVYDQIIFDCSSGPRILINDRKPIGASDNQEQEVITTAYSINLDRNSGFADVIEFDKKTFYAKI